VSDTGGAGAAASGEPDPEPEPARDAARPTPAEWLDERAGVSASDEIASRAALSDADRELLEHEQTITSNVAATILILVISFVVSWWGVRNSFFLTEALADFLSSFGVSEVHPSTAITDIGIVAGILQVLIFALTLGISMLWMRQHLLTFYLPIFGIILSLWLTFITLILATVIDQQAIFQHFTITVP
jgi:hypothetical protein